MFQLDKVLELLYRILSRILEDFHYMHLLTLIATSNMCPKGKEMAKRLLTQRNIQEEITSNGPRTIILWNCDTFHFHKLSRRRSRIQEQMIHRGGLYNSPGRPRAGKYPVGMGGAPGSPLRSNDRVALERKPSCRWLRSRWRMSPGGMGSALQSRPLQRSCQAQTRGRTTVPD